MIADLRLGRWQDRLADIPDGSVRLILTSPPYDNARTYEGTNEPVDFAELARFCIRVLMPGGVLAMVLDGAVNDGRQSITHMETVVAWSRLDGWRFLQELSYGRQGAPGEYKGRFRRDREPLYIFVRDGAEHVCAKDRLAERATHPYTAGRVRERDGSLRGASKSTQGARERKNRGSFWWYGPVSAIDPSADTGHPATFAEVFALDAVTVWSNPGDLVVDPYAGSATVGRACIDLGRRWIGAERVGPCPSCHDPRPGPCGCPREHRNYHAIGMQRLAQTSIFSSDLCSGALS